VTLLGLERDSSRRYATRSVMVNENTARALSLMTVAAR